MTFILGTVHDRSIHYILHVTSISFSKPTPWAVIGPNGQPASTTLPMKEKIPTYNLIFNLCCMIKYNLRFGLANDIFLYRINVRSYFSTNDGLGQIGMETWSITYTQIFGKGVSLHIFSGLPPSGKISESQAEFYFSGKSGKVREFNTHCYRNPPHDLWSRSGISFLGHQS